MKFYQNVTTLLKSLSIRIFLLSLLTASSYAETYVKIESEPGDYIGGGATSTFLTVTGSSFGSKTGVRFSAGGFTYYFESDSGQLNSGLYENATRHPFNLDGVAGLSVSGNGRGCNTLTGSFIIHDLEFGADTTIIKAAIDFEQLCGGGVPAMFGFIRFNSDLDIPDQDNDDISDIQDNCVDTANTDQIDTDGDGIGNICDPIQGATFVYLDSESGDYIGQGQTWLFTQQEGGVTMSNSTNTGYIRLSAGGFTYSFEALQTESLTVGIYEGATRYPFNDPTEPGLNVSGNGRGCNKLTGNFEIIELERSDDGKVEHFAADFTQHCEGSSGALYGIVRYNSELAGTDEFDDDQDGVINPADNCSNIANSDQINSDGDEFGDACDPYSMDADNLAACLLEPRSSDLDNDGELDQTDNCPNTPPDAEVDDSGCSQQQFCSNVDATSRRGARICYKSDWKNDEPLMRSKNRDCTVARGGSEKSDKLCRATTP